MSTSLDPNGVRVRIAESAHRLGCDLIGIAPAEPPARAQWFRQWLSEGRAGTMTYLHGSQDKRCDPRLVLEGARAIIVVGQSYYSGRLPQVVRDDPSRGIIAAYAWGRDYHDVLLPKLETLARQVRELAPGTRTLCYVDTGPILERDHAERAGLGFIGKNTLLIAPRHGSAYFLGVILTTFDLPKSQPPQMPGCGSCTRCLAKCPTGALVGEYVLDATRCISYLTIEYKGIIPRELRPLMGNHLFGCDDCQDCCPWTQRFSSETGESAYHGSLERQAPCLIDLAQLTATQFREYFAGSPVLRARYEGLLRNVAVALGNWGSEAALEGLQLLLRHESALVRAHAAWGAGRVRDSRAAELLLAALTRESSELVRAEIHASLIQG